MRSVVRSISGISGETAFALGKDTRLNYPLESPEGLESIPGLFAYPVKNIGRFPGHVKSACGACALALKAAGMEYKKNETQKTAVLTAGYDPTLHINGTFFKDYLDAGRTMGRGNLFIYSLPTGAIAEVSIHFGFSGPALFVESPQAPLKGLLVSADEIMSGKDADSAVLFWQDDRYTICVIADGESPAYPFLTEVEELQRLSADWCRPEEAVRHCYAGVGKTEGNPISYIKR